MTEQTTLSRTLFGVIRYTFLSMTGAYALSTAGFLFLRLVIGERVGLIGFMNSLVHLLVLPALILLPLCLLLRKWQQAAMLFPAVLAFAIWYAPMLLPHNTPQIPADAETVTVLTFNLEAKTQQNNLLEIAEIIRSADADLVALQEFSAEAAAYLETELEDEYPHQRSSTFPGDPIGGQGILSRYPIEEYNTFRTRFLNQEAIIEINGQRISLYNVHVVMPLHSGFATRNRDVQAMIERTLKSEYPVILAGDFNMTDRSDGYQSAREYYGDAFYDAGQGLGLTFMTGVSRIPLIRLDYVFYDDTFTALEANVIEASAGSDHRPMRTVLAVSSD